MKLRFLEELIISQSSPGASPLYNTKMYMAGRHVAGGGWEPTPNFDKTEALSLDIDDSETDA